MKMLTLCILLILAVVTPAVLAQDRPAKAATEKKAAGSKFENIKPERFDALRKADTNNTVLLDVRTKKEYRDGHIPGSILIDFNADDFDKELAKLDKNKTYLVHCAAGGRSARACKKMDQLGFKKVYNLQGGMGAWEKAGKPVQK